MDVLKFTVLDDSTHVIGPGEYTVCGIAIPFGNGYSTDVPKKLCSDCKARIKDTDEFGATKVDLEDEPVKATKDTEDAPKPAATKAKTGAKA